MRAADRPADLAGAAPAPPLVDAAAAPLASPDEAAAIDFIALLTGEQVDELEDGYEERWGMVRRVGLVALTRSKAELVQGFRDVPATLVDIVENVGDYVRHCRAAAELAENAHARLIVAASAVVAGQPAATASPCVAPHPS